MENLIGIAGKMQSGKDTIGKIIQYLTCKNMNKDSYWSQADFFGDNFHAAKWLSLNSDYQIKKFADSLKDMVCILLNCTKEQLEDKEFKEKELGEEWAIWKVLLINGSRFGGLYLDKKTAKYTSQFSSLQPTEVVKEILTPRKLLQLLGTECGRKIIHPNIWCNSLMSKYKPRKAILISKDCPRQDIYSLTEEDEIIYGTIGELYPNWIITDVRFPNEADAIKERGGIIIRVNRKHGYNTPDRKWKEMPLNYHESETALDSYDFDYVIENDTTIAELKEKVKSIWKIK